MREGPGPLRAIAGPRKTFFHALRPLVTPSTHRGVQARVMRRARAGCLPHLSGPAALQALPLLLALRKEKEQGGKWASNQLCCSLLCRATQLSSWPGQLASDGASLPSPGNGQVGVPTNAPLSCPLLKWAASMLKPALLISPGPGPSRLLDAGTLAPPTPSRQLCERLPSDGPLAVEFPPQEGLLGINFIFLMNF